MEAIAVHTFHPTAEDELGFEKGSMLYITELEEDPNWFKARQGQQEGMVPANYIALNSHPWYIPKCGRREAEARLLEVNPQTNTDIQPDGAFIVRQSENEFAQFSLSVKDGSSILHFRIFFRPPDQYYIWNNHFQSVNKLIEYHRYQTIYGDKALLLHDCVPSLRYGPVGAGLNPRFTHHSTRPTTESNRSHPEQFHSNVSGRPLDDARPPSTGHTNTTGLPPGISSTHLAGRYCVAKFDFCAEFEGELSFRRGDRIRLLGEEDDNWWYGELLASHSHAEVTNRGLIPANYVQLLPQDRSAGNSRFSPR